MMASIATTSVFILTTFPASAQSAEAEVLTVTGGVRSEGFLTPTQARLLDDLDNTGDVALVDFRRCQALNFCIRHLFVHWTEEFGFPKPVICCKVE
jgi:hypothetical protein